MQYILKGDGRMIQPITLLLIGLSQEHISSTMSIYLDFGYCYFMLGLFKFHLRISIASEIERNKRIQIRNMLL